MKLKYRGVAYESNLTEVTTVEGKVGGKYRGVPWVQKVPQITRVDEPNVELKYRGVSYRKGAVKLAKTVPTHPEMLPEQPPKPTRSKVKH